MKILAPLKGEVIPIAEVSDPVFGEEILGKGVAIRPTGNRVVSPIKGIVTQMFDTGHAVSLTSDDGVEVLIHVGLDTVRLKGEHYTPRVKEGDNVNPGDVLIEFNREGIAAGYDTTTPIVICNSDDFKDFDMIVEKTVSEGDEIMLLRRK